jgi:hypothetical protein
MAAVFYVLAVPLVLFAGSDRTEGPKGLQGHKLRNYVNFRTSQSPSAGES